MSEHDHDLLLREAFGQFRQDVMPHVHAAGAAAAIGTARSRRRVRIATTVAAALVILVSVPAIVLGALRGGPNVGPQPGTSTSVTPTVTSGPSPTSTPSPTTDPLTTTPATTGAGELANASLPVDWSWIPRPEGAPASVPDPLCESGQVQFSNGAYQYPALYGQRIASVARADVNRDGTPETLALIECFWAQTPSVQVIALGTSPTGAYTAVGVVARTDTVVRGISEFSVDSGGGVQVRVANGVACCGNPESAVQRQWRGFAWNGSAFTQVSGPSTFDAGTGAPT